MPLHDSPSQAAAAEAGAAPGGCLEPRPSLLTDQAAAKAAFMQR